MADNCIFICDPWDSYIAQLIADGDRQELEQENEADLEQEQLLARGFFDDLEEDDDAEWPWYADIPYEIEPPEIIET